MLYLVEMQIKEASEAFDALDYIKNLMGSRKVIKMMNHLGHCTSYQTTEEVEIEATFESAILFFSGFFYLKMNSIHYGINGNFFFYAVFVLTRKIVLEK